MVQTIYEVKEYAQGSCNHTTFFEDLKSAKKFASAIVEENKDDYVYSKRHYVDGSLCISWTGDVHEITITDGYATDYRVNGIRLYQSDGIYWDFDNEKRMKEFINKTQKER